MHEYGHTIDSRLFGPAFLFGVGIPSIFSANGSKQIAGEDIGVSTHKMYWSEIRANKHAKKYFGENYRVDWNTPYHIWGDYYLQFYDTTIETFYPTKKR